MAFRPTVFKFEPAGFVCVRRGEYVSWGAKKAVSSETISMGEALTRWNVEARFVADLDDVVARLTAGDVYFEEQT